MENKKENSQDVNINWYNTNYLNTYLKYLKNNVY